MKTQILDHLKQVITGDKKRYGKLVKYDGQSGFSEDAIKGLEDLEARTPPPEAYIEPANPPSYVHRTRLSPENAAGGGLVKGDDGAFAVIKALRPPATAELGTLTRNSPEFLGPMNPSRRAALRLQNV